MNKGNNLRLATLVVLVILISSLHYFTTTQLPQFHDVYRRLYYIPIVLGGLWFGLRGGLGVSLAASLLYAPHIVFQWGHHPTSSPEKFLEIMLYNIIGGLTGFLAAREREQKIKYQRAAQRLEHSYDKLREQADQILDIEEQLRRADRLSALGELSAGMAHEIRNPLGSIRGTAEILRDGVRPDDRHYEFASILIREVDRLNQVVGDFLNFARPQSNERGHFDLVNVLREVLVLTAQQAKANHVTLNFTPQGPCPLQGDAEQLKQVFLNLVLNALQAMPQGGALDIEIDVRELVTIRFRDTGQGIPADQLDKIFNPFFTSRSEGTGLGLAITHRIIQGHGGRIDVASKVGQGTTFTLVLPLHTNDKERAL
ncbi:MAG: ATP-binding protein [Desulfuromonadales bacterium]|nr:ATP-binding protein [Desulfuromonadales bacterium]MDT8422142.1 ATP-binding protein [Desulfuromonadales bacterium]